MKGYKAILVADVAVGLENLTATTVGVTGNSLFILAYRACWLVRLTSTVQASTA